MLVNINKEEALALETTGEEIPSGIIAAAQDSLKKLFPDVCGLQNTFYISENRNLIQIPVGTFSVQIHHLKREGIGHWVVSYSNSDVNKEVQVHVIDSFYRDFGSDLELQNQLVNLYKKFAKTTQINSKTLDVNISHMRQMKKNTCGLFAMAFAYRLCQNKVNK